MRIGSSAADVGFKAEGLIEVVRGLGYRGLGFRVASFRFFGVWGMRESGLATVRRVGFEHVF